MSSKLDSGTPEETDMLKDFYAHYPIRKKFDIILGVLLAIAIIPAAHSAVELVGGNGDALWEMIGELAVLMAVGAFVLYAKRRSVTPM